MDSLIDCISNLAKQKGQTMEKFINQTLIDSYSRNPNLGTNGRVVYPSIDEPVIIKDGETYVPGLNVMLSENYEKAKQIKGGQDKIIKNQYKVPDGPIGWYMSEKFDGQRAIWDGKKFISRGSSSGNPKVYSYVPIWFVALMPPGIPLDGEFFIARDSFTETTSILKKKLKPENQRTKKDISQQELDKLWVKIKYQVFDTISNELFEERQTKLKKIVKERCAIWKELSIPGYIKKGLCPLILTEQYLIKTPSDVNTFYNSLTNEKAEGVMIRAPGIPYIPRRTKFILKLKVEEDAECIIKGPHKPGEGKYSGMVGSFRCQLIENDKPVNKYTYLSGITDQVRQEGIPENTIITYTYNGITPDGLPRHPRFKGFPSDR